MADSNEVNITITASDNASKALAAVGQVIESISGRVKAVTGDFMAYGAEIKDLASYTGLSSEETSRLAQAADDAGVSFQTLSQAAKALTMDNAANAKETEKLTGEISKIKKELAAKPSEELRLKLKDLETQLQAIKPAANLSIETLAQLSDEFIKIKDPAQQTIFLQERLGRAGQDLAKFLRLGGNAIRENAKSVADSLIIDDAKAARIENMRVKLDNFNDQLQGLKFEAADQLLKIFEQMPKPIQDATLALGSFLSPTNINSLIQFGILIKGLNFGALAAGAWSFAGGMLAAVAPIAAVLAAAFALYKIFEMDEFKQGISLLLGGAVGALSGNREGVQAEATRRTYRALGGGTAQGAETGNFVRSTLSGLQPLALAGAQAGGGTTVINYQPFISTEERLKSIELLRSIANEIQRTNPGR